VIYSGQQDPTVGLGHAQTVVMNLLDGLLGCYRTVVADNFFTSISLAERLLEHDTYLIETLRNNRVASGNKVLLKELRRREVYGIQNKDGIKLIMWKDKRDVLMISTRPLHSATVVDTEKINI
jgi:hypothetical protein